MRGMRGTLVIKKGRKHEGNNSEGIYKRGGEKGRRTCKR